MLNCEICVLAWRQCQMSAASASASIGIDLVFVFVYEMNSSNTCVDFQSSSLRPIISPSRQKIIFYSYSKSMIDVLVETKIWKIYIVISYLTYLCIF